MQNRVEIFGLSRLPLIIFVVGLLFIAGLLWISISNGGGLSLAEVSAVIEPMVVDGRMDLSEWDFEKNGPVSLDGEWHFYWGELMTAEEINGRPDGPDARLMVPSPWIADEEANLQANGIGTYHLQIKLPPRSPMMAVKVGVIDTVFEMYANQERVTYAGSLGPNPDEYVPGFGPRLGYVRPQSDTIDLIVHVGNYAFRNPGITQSIEFGDAASIVRLREVDLVLEFSLAGAALIMGFYHFGLYTTRKRENDSALTFGFFCVLMAVRILVTGSNFLMELFPALHWPTIIRINFLTFYLGVPVFYHFVHQLYPKELTKTLMWATWTISLGVSLLTVLVPVAVFVHFLTPYQIFFLLTSVYVLFAIILACIR
ncbi:MAG: 7TM-DISM domain-containing protein, partial [Chloroflexota bacterium]